MVSTSVREQVKSTNIQQLTGLGYFTFGLAFFVGDFVVFFCLGEGVQEKSVLVVWE